jgi:hypothetical protein
MNTPENPSNFGTQNGKAKSLKAKIVAQIARLVRQAGLDYQGWRYVAKKVRQVCELRPATKGRKLPKVLTADEFRRFYVVVDRAEDVLVVEADSVSDTFDELADSTEFGHHVVVPDEDLGDYAEDQRHYGPSGQVIDLDNVMAYGQEGSDCPWPCRYFGEGLPEEGILPTEYWRREED